jgi:hypothetical protein
MEESARICGAESVGIRRRERYREQRAWEYGGESVIMQMRISSCAEEFMCGGVHVRRRDEKA